MRPSEEPAATSPVDLETGSEEETLEAGARLGRELAPDGIVLLEGDLGAGKTVLVRGMARGLGVPEGEVQSPTFSLIHEHQGSGGRLVHVDLYRLDPEDLDSLGLDELLEGPGVKAVEWADRLPWTVPGARRLRVLRSGPGHRRIEEVD